MRCEELVEYVICVCVWLGAALEERGVSGCEDWVWTLPSLLEQGECWTCGCVLVVLCLCEVRVWILCVDGRSRYLCIVLGGYLRI